MDRLRAAAFASFHDQEVAALRLLLGPLNYEDFLIIELHIDSQRDRGWRTFKRPGVEAFLEQLAQHYELVIYSDQLSYVSSRLLLLLLTSIDDEQ